MPMKVTLHPTGCSSRWTLNEGHDLERHRPGGGRGAGVGGEASHVNREEYGEGNHGDGKVITEAI